jgi:hypothetical protein
MDAEMQTAVDYLLTKGISVGKFGTCVFVRNHFARTFDKVEIGRRGMYKTRHTHTDEKCNTYL